MLVSSQEDLKKLSMKQSSQTYAILSVYKHEILIDVKIKYKIHYIFN